MGFLSNLFERVKIIENEGDSPENAVIIETNDHARMVIEEYRYISRRFGKGAKIVNRVLVVKGKRLYDKFRIKLPDGSMRDLFIDVTPKR